jgi:capsid protein
MKQPSKITSFLVRAALRIPAVRQALQTYSYNAAYATSAKEVANVNSYKGETSTGIMERLRMVWTATEAVENSGLASGLVGKIERYVAGQVRVQVRSGDRAVNSEAEAFLRERLGSQVDYAGRLTFRRMCGLAIRQAVISGDCGQNRIIEEGVMRLQLIPGRNIGSPYTYIPEPVELYGEKLTSVSGILVDEYNAIKGARIYAMSRIGQVYEHVCDLRAYNETGDRIFSLFAHQTEPDLVRGRTAFFAVLPQIQYLAKMRELELQVQTWAASQGGVYYTQSGMVPMTPDLPFGEQAHTMPNGETQRNFTALPNQIQALGVAERVELFKNDRPSPNVMNMYREVIREVCASIGISFAFGWEATGLPGPAVRAASMADKRTIEDWQTLLREQFIDDVVRWKLDKEFRATTNYRGPLPFGVLFPAWPTIDQGRETAADLSRYRAGLTNGHMLADESGEDFDEIRNGRINEILRDAETAEQLAKSTGLPKDLVMALLSDLNANSLTSFSKSNVDNAAALEHVASADEQQKGATSDGTEL